MKAASFAALSIETCRETVSAATLLDVAEPAWLGRGQIPSLHGFRALSILLVLIAHLAQQGTWLPRIWHLTELGRLGVDMFFVISGFLITVLLLREQARHEAISLKQFYLRRACRILPAYLFFLLGIGVLQQVNVVTLTGWDWLGASTYSVGFLPAPSWDIGHIWSLSVEEHFYLLWPLAICFWPRRGWIVAALTIVVTPPLRWLIHAQCPDLHVAYCTLTRMDTIAVGCGLAYLAHWPTFRRWLHVSARSAYLLTIVMLLGVALSERLAQRVPAYQILVHPLLVASLDALAIWLWSQHSHTWLGVVLNSRTAVVIGSLSYSLYLWQQPFLNPHSSAWHTQFPANVIGLCVMASLSYLLIERPFLRLKDRLPKERPAAASLLR